MWNQHKYTKRKFKFGDYVLWYPKGEKMHLGKFTNKWFGPYEVQFCLPNNDVLLVTLDKFDHVVMNVKKLKPYQFLDEEAHITN
jgi:hypothetical protein